MALIAARSVLSAGLGLLKGGHRSAFPVVSFNVSRSSCQTNILWNQDESSGTPEFVFRLRLMYLG